MKRKIEKKKHYLFYFKAENLFIEMKHINTKHIINIYTLTHINIYILLKKMLNFIYFYEQSD